MRWKVTGEWHGLYSFKQPAEVAGLEPVAFTLALKQGWLASFEGTVTEDAVHGIPGTGTVKGYFAFPRIEFTKLMPVGYFSMPDGSKITVREYLASMGYVFENELPPAPIFYKGIFLDTNRAQGTWIIKPLRISLPDGKCLTTKGTTTGIWSIENQA